MRLYLIKGFIKYSMNASIEKYGFIYFIITIIFNFRMIKRYICEKLYLKSFINEKVYLRNGLFEKDNLNRFIYKKIYLIETFIPVWKKNVLHFL